MALRKSSRVSSLACKYQTRTSTSADTSANTTKQDSIVESSETSKCVSTKKKSTTKQFAASVKREECILEGISLPKVKKNDYSTKRAAASVKNEEDIPEGIPSPKAKRNDNEVSHKVDIAAIKLEPVEFKEEPCDGWTPPNWVQVVENIRLMRKNVLAPVDTMGCDMCHDRLVSPAIQRYQILVSLMLSSQTKDQVTFAAMGRLREHGLTPQNMVETSNGILEELIKPVGFYKRKSEYIKRASQILLDSYNGDIPQSVEELCKLPGVGPKMAHICMSSAWNVVSGIGVDTHVHRISQRLGWLPQDVIKKRKKVENLTPEDTRKALESWLPRNLWSEVNHLLVGFGQTICKPIGPSCSACLNNSICPAAQLKW